MATILKLAFLHLRIWVYASLAAASTLPMTPEPILIATTSKTCTRPTIAHRAHEGTTAENVQYGEAETSRTIFTLVSILCMTLMASMLGYRARQYRWSQLKCMNFTRFLVLALYLMAMSFILAASIIESGLGLSTLSVCQAAIDICLAFYVSSKVIIYVFLVERAHAIRAPYVDRCHDWIWVTGMVLIASGFGSIAILGFLDPVVELSSLDGHCRIGLPLKVTIPLLSFDICMNVALTGTFIFLLWPLLRFGGMSDVSFLARCLRRFVKTPERQSSVGPYPMNRNFLQAMERLLWKSLVGSFMVIIPTVGNMALFYRIDGRELAWLCLMICSFDDFANTRPASSMQVGIRQKDANRKQLHGLYASLTGSP